MEMYNIQLGFILVLLIIDHQKLSVFCNIRRYAGCFADQHDRRTLPYCRLDNQGKMTNDLCLSHCCTFLKDSIFMGSEDGFQCYCSNLTNSQTFLQLDERYCDVPCDGNGNEKCGGVKSLSIYRIGCSDTTKAIYSFNDNNIYTETPHVQSDVDLTTYPENTGSTPSVTPEITTGSLTTSNEYTNNPVRKSTSSISTFSSTTTSIKTTTYQKSTQTIFTVSQRVQTDTKSTKFQENADSTPPGTPEITTTSAFRTDSLTTNNEPTEKPVTTSSSTFSTLSSTTGDKTSEDGRNVSYCSCANCVLKNQTLLTESDPENIFNLVNLRINKKDTNKYKRTKQSAFDSRKSSRYLGLGGVIVILLPIMFIISIDVLKFFSVA